MQDQLNEKQLNQQQEQQLFHLLNQNQVFVRLLSMQVENSSNLRVVPMMHDLHIHHLLVHKIHVHLRVPIEKRKKSNILY
jgi:hypothetical protein